MKKIKEDINSNILWLFIAGISCGWMIGMTVSPVMGSILGTLITIIVGVTSILAGLPSSTKSDKGKNTDEGKGRIAVLPVGVLTLAIAIGAAIGIFTRSNKILDFNFEVTNSKPFVSVDIDSIVSTYTRWGLDSSLVAQKILDSQFESEFSYSGKVKSEKGKNELGGYLFNHSLIKADCGIFCTLDANTIRKKIHLEYSNDCYLQCLSNLEDEELIDIIQKECCE